MAAARRGLDIGLVGAALDLLLAVLLGIVLSIATESSGDALPRPVILAVLFGVPGLIGLLGVRSLRPALLVGAAVPLLPGALLSWVGLTVPFGLAALLMLVGAARMHRDTLERQGGSALRGALIAGLIATLLVIAGWSTLLGLTEPGCVSIPGGQHCSSAFISVRGLLVGAACLGGALAIAAWSAGVLRRRLS